MAIVFVSMASWKALVDVYEGFEEEVLIRDMSSMRISNCDVMVSSPDFVDMIVWGC